MSRTRVPKEEGKFTVWYQNFKNNLSADIAAQIGVVAAELARVANDSTAFNYLVLRNAAVRAYKDEESTVKQRAFDEKSGGAAMTLPSLKLPKEPADTTYNVGIWDWVNKLVQRIVKHDGCTPEIEALLDIQVKEGDSISRDELRQEIKQATALNDGHVRIKCSMLGRKAYRVLSQRGDSDAFEAVGDSTQPEFIDERPNLVKGQPETRQYKTVCLEGNKPVGDYSATETVITKP